MKNQLKKFNNSRIQIPIRIFTKIESILRCYTPNMSTKFRPDPSSTFWDIVLYIGVAPSLNGEESLKILVVGSGSGSGSSLKSNQFVLISHRTCPQNFIRIRPQLFEISCTQTNKQTNKPVGEDGPIWIITPGIAEISNCYSSLNIDSIFFTQYTRLLDL